MKHFIKILSLSLLFVMFAPMLPAVTAENDPPSMSGSILDRIIFGDSASENFHKFEEHLSVAGIDDKKEDEYTNSNGMLAGGGIGDGLSYRYLKPPAEGQEKSKLEFTLKADPVRQNYLTVRLSGSQQSRGNLMLYGPNGDTSILNPFAGRVYSELDTGYYAGAPFLGRYYYSTYRIPQELVNTDGTVRLSIIAVGRIDAYGTDVYTVQTQNSKYIYEAATHTDPFYIPQDNFTGEVPIANSSETREQSPYDYIKDQVNYLTGLYMTWQLYGEKFESYKTENNAFLEGAVVKYETVDSHKDFKGTKDEWSRKLSIKAINHQNWSPMAVAQMYANAFMFEFSGDYYQNPEVLDRFFALLDFYVRAQDIQGGWCYYEKGEDTGKWLGASFDGTGERLKGENWPLMTLGADYMVQAFTQLHNYIMNSENENMKSDYLKYFDEIIDGDLTGKMNKTRREFYIEMFAKLRNYIAGPESGNFYDPKKRAGTANQDFGFAYDSNRAVSLLFDTIEYSKVNKAADIPKEYHVKDNTEYIKQLKYKFGEMVDGQKWLSDLGVGLEGGVSHGGWAGEYGQLILRCLNLYAETAENSQDLKEYFADVSKSAYDAAQYFLHPSVTTQGYNILLSETWGGSRGSGYGQKAGYPLGGYTALKSGSAGALRIMQRYVEDNRAYSEDVRTYVEKGTPHVFTTLVEAQEIVKYYKEIEDLLAKQKSEGTITYLPMEKEHPDFAWADVDSQSVVFKNNGDRAYFTFNYRRNDWEYNDNVRVHFTTDTIDRVADVTGSHKGGLFQFTDKTPNDAEFTHTRYDGYSQVRYGKYLIGMNFSKDDSDIGQDGKVYALDTLGIKKAQDIMNGQMYESTNGEDIKVYANPRQTVILEVLSEQPTFDISALYVENNNVLGYDNVSKILGEEITVHAQKIEGYKLESEAQKTITVSNDNTRNTVIFNYSKNTAPYFTENEFTGTDAGWKTINIDGAIGDVVFGDDGNPSSIISTGKDGSVTGLTFAYKEVTGDTEIKANLQKIARTATDKDYASIIITDSLDLINANYVQLRHFSNNNNILLISHNEEQGNSVKGYWAGDMNNKNVPIWFRLVKNNDNFRYWFSLEGDKNYQETTKPTIDFKLNDTLYVGVAMTSASEAENTAAWGDIQIKGNLVAHPVKTGDEVSLNFNYEDIDNDTVTFNFYGAPEWLNYDKSTKTLSGTAEAQGDYMIVGEVRDSYHALPSRKVIRLLVGESKDKHITGARDVYVTEGEAAELTTAANGVTLINIYDAPKGTIFDNGHFRFDTSAGDTGVYRITLRYDFDDYAVTKVVKITVNEAIILDGWLGTVDELYITVNIDGKRVQTDTYPLEIDGRVLVPVRVITENLGASVEWNEDTNQAVITYDNTQIVLQSDNVWALVNGENRELDVSATLINNRMMVPVRFIAETFGARVDWNEDTQTVMILSKP